MQPSSRLVLLIAGFIAGIVFVVACSQRAATNRPGLGRTDMGVDAPGRHDAGGHARDMGGRDTGVDAGRDARAQGMGTGSVITVNGHAYSLDAVFRMATSATYNGAAVGGPAGAKAICEAATGSPSAHMCSTEEMVRSVQIGIVPPAATPTECVYGWTFGGLYVPVPNNGSSSQGDCLGWTSALSVWAGAVWSSGSCGVTVPYAATSTCDHANLVFCCDSPM